MIYEKKYYTHELLNAVEEMLLLRSLLDLKSLWSALIEQIITNFEWISQNIYLTM